MTVPAKALKVGVIFLGRRRPGFDPEWGEAMAARARSVATSSEFDVFEPSVKVIDDSSLREALATLQPAGVDVALTLQTTMADARLAPTFSQLWPDPIVLWATPEKQEGDMISSCSLVGVHAWASILRQMRHSFEIVYGAPEEEDTRRQLSEAVRLAYAARRLRMARLGVVGGQSPGYFAMSADPFALRLGLGVQAQSFSLMEFADAVYGQSDAAVAGDVATVKAIGIPFKDVTDEDLPMASRLYLAMRQMMDEESLDALAVRCWPEMPAKFGQWPYLGMARLAEEGRAIACEGDADGALTALVGECLGVGRCHLSDWLEHDGETITLWHGGAAPMSLCPAPGEPGGPRIARHFNNQKPAVIEAVLREGLPITICRLWHCEGRYRITARDAETIPPRRRLMGTNGLARVKDCDPREWFLELCHEGMPHHVAVFPGNHAALLRRFARATNIAWIA